MILIVYIDMYLMVMLMCYSYYVVPDDSDAFKSLFSRGGNSFQLGPGPSNMLADGKLQIYERGRFAALLCSDSCS